VNSDTFLKIDQISVAYDADQTAIANIGFHVQQGELACLLGPSGCGKTTILRAICGFVNLQDGSIELDQALISRPDYHLETERRQIGMVFQEHALFPHMDVATNIGFGLNKLSRKERQERVAELLELVGLIDFANRFPHELSGGQSQRVALARALAPRPKLLLMDEPFSSLDKSLRESLGLEIRALLRTLNMTAILVTHDHQEAFALADQVGVMSQGKLEQWGTPKSVYKQPATAEVAKFIGVGSLLQGQLSMTRPFPQQVVTHFGQHSARLEPHRADDQPMVSDSVKVLIRPHQLQIDKKHGKPASIIKSTLRHSTLELLLELENGETLMACLPVEQDFEVGDQIRISLSTDRLQVFTDN